MIYNSICIKHIRQNVCINHISIALHSAKLNMNSTWPPFTALIASARQNPLKRSKQSRGAGAMLNRGEKWPGALRLLEETPPLPKHLAI